MSAKRLGQLLLDLGWISDRDLTRALNAQEVLGGRLGTCLLEVDALNEQLLNQALQQQLGVEAVRPLDLQNVPPPVFGALPAKVAVRCQAVPYRLLGKDLWVALLDVHNLGLLDEIAFATGKTVRARIANEHRIEIALEHYYSRTTTSRFKQLFKRLQEEDPTAMILVPPSEEEEAIRIQQGKNGIVGVSNPIIAPGAGVRSQDPEFEILLATDKPAQATIPLPPVPQPQPPVSQDHSSELADTDVHDILTVKTSPLPLIHEIDKEDRDLEDEIGLAIDSIGPVDTHTQPVTWIPVGPEPRDQSVASVLHGDSFADSSDEVIGRLFDAGSRDAIGLELVHFLNRRFERVCLISSSRGEFRGWMGDGTDFDVDLFSEYRAAESEPSVFLNLKSAGAFYAGALAPMPAHSRLMRCWDAGLPGEAVVVPIRLGERVVAFLFCDPAGKGLERSDIEELCHLAGSMSSALHNLIVRKKQGA